MKRSGQKTARASTAKRKTAARQDVPQFAPNFTVYVLPPDTVCLYSEDRKFFLHGEVYCALAAIIGKGGKGFPEIAAELSKNFPPDEIEQALKGLMERRYIVPASSSTAVAVIGRASVCRLMLPSKILRIAACASRRSTSRARPNSAPP